jgi:uncharacterized FAD-dependent dehydrogenase
MKTFELVVLPEEAANKQQLQILLEQTFGSSYQYRILKKSIDARSRIVKVRLLVAALSESDITETVIAIRKWQNVQNCEPVMIVGSGPAGLFAAIRLIELGFKPIIVERGKDVRLRRRDLAAINKNRVVNPESNYCFGEGGAGTYSDGKLYTRSSKRGNINTILHTFIEHGASADIAVDAHPHIGTNKLPHIISAMRHNIEQCGGIFYFQTQLKDLITDAGKIKGIMLQEQGGRMAYSVAVRAVVLATGHSARDVYEMLHRNNIMVEAKPFALGVRAEHEQQIIDRAQYHCQTPNPYLPPASYALKHQYKGRGVYSFCMCPGGIIAPAATNMGEVVVNGWSPSRRNNPFANSGIVVSITEEDVSRYSNYGELRYLEFQKRVEQNAFSKAGSNLMAPAQRMEDFVKGKCSTTLPECSYLPGIQSVELAEVLPETVTLALCEAFKSFGQKMKGYFTNEAVLVAVESRTSSAVRIPRHADTAMHVQIAGLFPCGEGAGYAGGIVSAAMDGEYCAVKCADYLNGFS